MTQRPVSEQHVPLPRVRLDIVEQVVVFVEDMDRARDFYRDVLGLQVRFEHEGWVEFSTRGAGIALCSGGRRSEGPKDYRGGGVLPTLRVQSVEAAVQYLRSRGVSVNETAVEPYGRLAVFSDPEGNQLQILEPHE